MSELLGRNILLVIPPARFKDIELDTVKRFLERKKATMKIASTTKRDVFGMEKMRARPDLLLEEVVVKDWEAIVFIGGMGAREFWDLEAAHRICREAVEAGILLGATSFAPIILARAGLLEGREATVYFSETKQIIERGAKYTGANVALDGRILTCKGPEAMEKFTLALIKLVLETPRPSPAGEETPA